MYVKNGYKLVGSRIITPDTTGVGWGSVGEYLTKDSLTKGLPYWTGQTPVPGIEETLGPS
jgi:hypothetical protein